jgi:predicted enzyme related to lactoylglutathione lyase
MPRVVHFEIPADDPQRATAFYGDVFGWQLQKWEGPIEYWLVTTGEDGAPGINGALMRRSPQFPGVVNTVDVPDVDEYVARIERAGGRIASPKAAIPGVGWLAYALDPEGNPFGIMQADPEAR